MSAEPIPSLLLLSDEKASLLARLVDGLDPVTLGWLSGYTAALAHSAPITERESLALVALPSSAQATIVYGSQTGNARRVAENLARDFAQAGLPHRLLRADDYPLRELKNERAIYIVISTQGDGDPPEDARGFVEFLASKRAPRLDELKFAVLALGDSSYAKFCAVGAQIDARLAELGAERLFARGEADVDVETVAQPWSTRALQTAREQVVADAPPLATVTPLRQNRTPISWTRDRPFAASVLLNQRISARDAGKDIRHIELSLQDSGLTYEPGDALGVWPTNSPELVSEIVESLRLDPQTIVTHEQHTLPLRDWLIEKRELTRLSRPFALTHASRAKDKTLESALSDAATSQSLLAEHQVVDLLQRFPASWDAASLVAALRPLVPRMYSIASSAKFAEGEAHLTVASVDYRRFDRARHGAASRFLSTRTDEHRVPIFIESNDRFRLPADASRDIIMIGPGTGVAPFRAFVQERAAIGARGRNWLFFGNPHFRSDFLYQLEWQAALKRGELHAIDLAFSRDQSDKIYVQHNLRRKGREVYDWLESCAHVYVCGDATRMAKDVHAALRDIVIEHGAKSADDADAYLSRLAAEHRYCRDVY